MHATQSDPMTTQSTSALISAEKIHLDDRQNRQDEYRGGVHLATFRRLAVGGMWGMLLSIPIIVIVKVISQQIEELHPLAELLGE